MSGDYIIGFLYEAIKVAIMLSAPMLMAGLLVGLLVSIFQSATSIHEATLTFVPKMLAVAAALVFFFPWMMQTLVAFTEQMFVGMNQFVH